MLAAFLLRFEHDNTWKTFHITKMANESETTVDTDKPKESLAGEEHIRRGRSDTMYSSYEMTRMRSNYENATEDHQRALSRAESRRSHGPPKGFGRIRSAIYDFWTHHISIVVAHDPRDHLGMFLLLTSTCLAPLCPMNVSSRPNLLD